MSCVVEKRIFRNLNFEQAEPRAPLRRNPTDERPDAERTDRLGVALSSSLAVMVSFGVAPALLTFNWALSDLGKVGWVAAFIYTACVALRLARFNAHRENDDTTHFTGLASPPAAATAA